MHTYVYLVLHIFKLFLDLLSAKGSQTYFGDYDNLYLKVLDGDLLYATTPACEVY